ncbi:serine/threonine protein kinase [Nonomuraea polychroma]|uniref:non-specific serine/threonine protein kinase n=1 Tax=Nonomuraea polychroma TaxID=46176 RepID=A0A438M1X6_9ACTN|nr:serine/threonine-protein kinase [Nonomuraea polychroma]RVX39523.1 serine/threonine protein kinase [Nonomuraea polychroma]
MSDSEGTIGGRYRLLRTIGKGGMGTVWQAHDEVLGRDVAVKEVLPPPDLTGPEREVFSVRTFREARAAGRVAHPGVATVYDVLEERGHPWIIMQLVQSRTLGELIREDGPMPPLEAANVGLQLLEALRAAHAAGVLHRDVKPDNVLLTEDGRAVLTDFGIATTEDEAPVTRTGVLIGTPAFMAPERAAGGSARPASDLWSLGVTLYMAVEGHSPFQRDNPLATLGAVMHAEPEPLARAGVLAPVLYGLLRKDPGERMTLEEAERRLTAIVAGGVPAQTGPVPLAVTAGAAGRPRRRLPLAAIGAGALLVGLVTGGAAWWSSRPADTPRPPPPTPVVVTTSLTPSSSPSSPSETVPQSSPESAYQPPASQSSPPPTREQPRTPDREKRTPSEEPTPTKSKEDKDDKGDKEDKEETPAESPDMVEGSGNGRASDVDKKESEKDD